MTYKVQLPVFEGPLDLLLYLIKKDEINIYDIPIAKITDQYLEYMEVMKMLDLEIAGEFILMAATLIHIKSKMLLPIEKKEEEVLKEVPKSRFHEVIKDEFTVSDKIHDILHVLVEKSVIYFSKLFTDAKNKIEIMAIFLALLELIKLKEVIVKQGEPFAEIEVMRNPEWQKK